MRLPFAWGTGKVDMRETRKVDGRVVALLFSSRPIAGRRRFKFFQGAYEKEAAAALSLFFLVCFVLFCFVQFVPFCYDR
jgi:hypothetical protein